MTRESRLIRALSAQPEYTDALLTGATQAAAIGFALTTAQDRYRQQRKDAA